MSKLIELGVGGTPEQMKALVEKLKKLPGVLTVDVEEEVIVNIVLADEGYDFSDFHRRIKAMLGSMYFMQLREVNYRQ